MEDCSDGEEHAAAVAVPDASCGETLRWHGNFGTGLSEGTELVVQWVEEATKGKVYKNYLGVLSGDFDEHSASRSHLVSYPTRVASKELGTSGNRVANPHLINLATLEVDFHEGDDDDSEPSAEYFSWW